MNVTFVNQHVNFTFRNGEVDTAAFQKDGLYLSDSGVDRLLSNLSLPAQSRHKYSQQHSQANTQRPANHDITDDTRTDNAWRVVQRRRHTQQRRSLGQCDKCGETNHLTIRCKHDQQVQCRRCGDWGHKEKHHTRDKENGPIDVAIAHSRELGRNRKWDLPVILNLNARSLSGEKLDELLVTVTDHNVSVVCITGTWFRVYRKL